MAEGLTLTAPDELAVASHGYMNVCMNECVYERVNVRQ